MQPLARDFTLFYRINAIPSNFSQRFTNYYFLPHLKGGFYFIFSQQAWHNFLNL